MHSVLTFHRFEEYIYLPFWAILKNSSYVSGLSVFIFVALCVWISVAGANKVEGTIWVDA